MPPEGAAPRAGVRSVLDGLRFLREARNLRMTFVLDLCAMVLAQPRALFPALADKVYGGSAATVGLLQAAPAAGRAGRVRVSGWIRGCGCTGWRSSWRCWRTAPRSPARA